MWGFVACRWLFANYIYVLRHVLEWDGIETSISPSFYETRPVRSTNAHLHKNMASQDDTTNDRDDVTEANQEKELQPSSSLSNRLRMIKTISMFLIYMGLVWTFLVTTFYGTQSKISTNWRIRCKNQRVFTSYMLIYFSIVLIPITSLVALLSGPFSWHSVCDAGGHGRAIWRFLWRSYSCANDESCRSDVRLSDWVTNGWSVWAASGHLPLFR